MSVDQSSALGPNGHPTGYDEEGNFVEFIPSEESDEPFPFILRRSDEAVRQALKELSDKVWWYRSSRQEDEVAVPALRRIEEQYGRGNLEAISEDEWLIMQGRLSALSWLTGDDWEGSMDT